MNRRKLWVAVGLLAPLPIAGCSLVYSYEDVRQPAAAEPDGGGASDATLVPDEGTPADGGGTITEDAPPADAPTTVPEAEAEAEAEAGPLAAAGAIVIGGVGSGDGGIEYVLSVLDPKSGHELSRERMPVVGVAYDGTLDRDLWYIFETLNPGAPFLSGPFPPSPGDPVVLHVRRLDAHTGAWTELAKVPVPTLLSPDLIAPLTKRLAYVAYSGDAGSAQDLVVLDTGDPAQATADAGDLSMSATHLGFGASGIIGTRAALSGAVGGTVTLTQNTSGGGGGDFQFVTAKVAASGVTLGASPVVVAPSTSQFSSIGVGSYLSGGPKNVFAVPPTADAGAVLVQYDPSTGAKSSAPDVPFTETATRFRPLAIAECNAAAFVPLVTGTTLLAVPLGGGTPASYDAMNSLSNVRFEPFTNSAIGTFNGSAGFEIVAITLGGGDGGALTLTPRNAASAVPWAPPADLRPTTIAVRQPIPFSCQ